VGQDDGCEVPRPSCIVTACTVRDLQQPVCGPERQIAQRDLPPANQAAELAIRQKTESISLNLLIDAAAAGVFKIPAEHEVDNALA
jgi:hypothetical protein